MYQSTITHTRHNSFVSIVRLLVLIALLLATVALAGCSTPNTAASDGISETDANTETAIQPDYASKRIIWVDSYHAEYEWSAAIETGIREALNGTGIELKVIRLDTKRNTDEAFGEQAGASAMADIEAFNPDVIIACDDNAQKYLVVPYLKDTDFSTVFCGVNWDASAYGYAATNVTGVIEVELPGQLVELLLPFADGETVAYLTVESETENKVAEIYNEQFFGGEMKLYAVKTVDEFKEAFMVAQEEADIVFLGNNAGIDQWDEAAMELFFQENTTVPTGTINPWMSPYALITLGKFGEEQGELAVQAALKILEGTAVTDIPVTENKHGQLILNLNLADKLDVVFAPSVLRNAEILGGEESK